MFHRAILFCAALALIQGCVATRGNIIKTSDELARRYSVQGSVIKVSGDTVYVDIGSRDKVSSGWVFRIPGEKQEIKNPSTGKILGTEETTKAKIELTSVKEKYSKGKIIFLKGKIAIGDRVVFLDSSLNVAVLRFKLVWGKSNTLADKVTTEMVEALRKTGRFKVYDRRDLDIIIDEQKLADTDFSALGKADIVVTGKIWDTDTRLQIESEAVEIATGRVIMVKREERKKYIGVFKKGFEYSYRILHDVGSLVAYIAGAFVRGFMEADYTRN